jgi:hypothetical protein
MNARLSIHGLRRAGNLGAQLESEAAAELIRFAVPLHARVERGAVGVTSMVNQKRGDSEQFTKLLTVPFLSLLYPVQISEDLAT